MRKLTLIAIGVAGVIALTVAVPVVAIYVSFARTVRIQDELEVVPGVRTVKESFVASYIVDAGPGKVVLVDAGIYPAAKPILAELARRHLGAEAVAAILLTHGHSDHAAGAAAFPRGAVAVLEPDVALAEGRAGSRSPLGRFVGVKPTGVKIARVLRDGETVRIGKAVFRVFAVPGHTPGSAAFLVKGALLLGDSADALRTGKMAGAKWIFSEDLAQNHASLKALAAKLKPLQVKAIAFAHSGPLQGLQPLLDFAAAP